MLRVASEGLGAGSGSAGVVEATDETVIISSEDELLSLVGADTVDVGSVGSSGEDSINVPSEFAGVGGELNRGGVGSARGVVFPGSVVALEVEMLVGSAVGADVGAVTGPVEGDNEGVVFVEVTTHSEVVADIVDSDVVVVGSDGEELTAGGDTEDLVPLLGVLDDVALGSVLEDGDTTIIS